MNKYSPLILLVSVFVISTTATASDNYISKKSPYTVVKTLDRLEKILKSKGITIFKQVDHGAGANKVAIPLRDSQLLIFGNPKLGSPLMQQAPMMGLELPMKALAWKDKQGQVWLSYLKPSVLQKRHDLSHQKIINKMTGALNAMTSKAVEK